MKWTTALQLGRVSNLPTVWSNVLAGSALAGVPLVSGRVLLTAVAMSLLYTAGMFLNDAFDVTWDRRHRPERPLVSGAATTREVVTISTLMLLLALVLLPVAAGSRHAVAALAGAVMLIALILLYNWKHKLWNFSPWLMGGCRLLVYIVAAIIAGNCGVAVFAAGLCLLCYIAGITYVARAEHLNRLAGYRSLLLLLFPVAIIVYLAGGDGRGWLAAVTVLGWLAWSLRFLLPDRRQVAVAVGSMLAGIALIDAAILFALQQTMLALSAVAAFVICLLLQRTVAAS